MGDLNDIIKKIKEGDEKAFKEFFLMFYADVVKFLYFYTGNEEIAKDLAQDTFVNFWKARERIKISENVAGYLFKIARNIGINYIEREKRQLRIDEIENISKSLVQPPDGESFEIRDAILNAINELPEKCREVFMLSRYTTLSHKEIADILGISLQTVKNHITKAMNFLRKKLAKYL